MHKVFLFLGTLLTLTPNLTAQEYAAVGTDKGIYLVNLTDSVESTVVRFDAALFGTQPDSLAVLDLRYHDGELLALLSTYEESSRFHNLALVSKSMTDTSEATIVIRAFSTDVIISGSLAPNNREIVIGGRERLLHHLNWDLTERSREFLFEPVGRAVHAAYSGDEQYIFVGMGYESHTIGIRKQYGAFPYGLIENNLYKSSILTRSLYSLPNTRGVAILGFNSSCIEVFEQSIDSIEYVVPCGDRSVSTFEYEPGYLRRDGILADGKLNRDYIFGKSGSVSSLYSTYEDRDLYEFSNAIRIQRVTSLEGYVSGVRDHSRADQLDGVRTAYRDGYVLITAPEPISRSSVWNAAGQRLEAGNLSTRGENAVALATAELLSGVYFVTIEVVGGQQKTERIVVSH